MASSVCRFSSELLDQKSFKRLAPASELITLHCELSILLATVCGRQCRFLDKHRVLCGVTETLNKHNVPSQITTPFRIQAILQVSGCLTEQKLYTSAWKAIRKLCTEQSRGIVFTDGMAVGSRDQHLRNLHRQIEVHDQCVGLPKLLNQRAAMSFTVYGFAHARLSITDDRVWEMAEMAAGLYQLVELVAISILPKN